jgi:hypothetical protein
MKLLPTRITLAAMSLLIGGLAQAATRSATFDTDNGGWLVSNISSAVGGGVSATWDNINQRIVTTDIATWTTYSAPASFLGDSSAFYGGSFSFDLQDDMKDANADTVATFGLASGVTTMYWFGGSPALAPTHFEAGLSPADTRWRLGGSPLDFSSGAAPTAAEFQAVLSNLTMLRINADWRTAGNDSTTLDNVVVQSAVPEPAQLWLLGAGIACLAWQRRARR